MTHPIFDRVDIVDVLLERTTNPLHKAMIRNHKRHAILEVCGFWEKILVPEMTVEHPVYRFDHEGGMFLFDGMEAVRSLYADFVSQGSTVMYHTDDHMAVSDQGLFMTWKSHRFYKGRVLASMGDSIDDPEGDYHVSYTLSQFWPYDGHARMKGEQVYRGRDRTVAKIPPAEVITLEVARDYLLPRLPALEDCTYYG